MEALKAMELEKDFDVPVLAAAAMNNALVNKNFLE